MLMFQNQMSLPMLNFGWNELCKDGTLVLPFQNCILTVLNCEFHLILEVSIDLSFFHDIKGMLQNPLWVFHWKKVLHIVNCISNHNCIGLNTTFGWGPVCNCWQKKCRVSWLTSYMSRRESKGSQQRFSQTAFKMQWGISVYDHSKVERALTRGVELCRYLRAEVS